MSGIRISVHVSFFVLVALVIGAGAQPGGPGIGSGLLWLVMVFACVVVHELAHSLRARATGATVRSIVLLPVGGVSQIERMPTDWRDELTIAAAGPAASLVLAILAGAGAAVTGAALWPVEIYGGPILSRLAWVNLLLAGFNLLPALPMDGGRVLRAAMERNGDPVTATRRAARLGRAFGVMMVAAGLLWDFWLIIIGAIVLLGASQEESSAVAHGMLRGHPVRQCMRAPVTTVDARQPAGILPKLWPGPHIVTLDGRYYGLVDTSSIRIREDERSVADLTDRTAPTVRPDDDLGESALDRLLTSGYRALAVVDGTTVVGVLLVADLIRWVDQAAA